MNEARMGSVILLLFSIIGTFASVAIYRSIEPPVVVTTTETVTVDETVTTTAAVDFLQPKCTPIGVYVGWMQTGSGFPPQSGVSYVRPSDRIVAYRVGMRVTPTYEDVQGYNIEYYIVLTRNDGQELRVGLFSSLAGPEYNLTLTSTCV